MNFQPHCLSYLRNAPDGLVLEFGVWKGDSTRWLAEVGRTVYAFDSFKGLPNDWGWNDRRGIFTCNRPELPENVVLIEGLFSDTLEAFLGEHDGVVGFAHIDCDIYTSCAHVLWCLRDRWARGAVIIFDEIGQEVKGEAIPGERRAWERHKDGWSLIDKVHSSGEVWRRD